MRSQNHLFIIAVFEKANYIQLLNGLLTEKNELNYSTSTIYNQNERPSHIAFYHDVVRNNV